MARHTAYSLRFGDLVGKSLSAWFRNFAPFTVLGLLVFAPWIVCLFLFPAIPEAGNERALVIRNIGMFLLQVLLAYVLTGAITVGVVSQLRGEPQSFGTSVSMGLRSFSRVLGTGLLCGVRIVIGFLLLYVPGIIESIRLYVAIPAAVVEGTAGNAAVRRSIDLTAGSRWTIFGAVLLMGLAAFGLALLAGFAVGALLGAGSQTLVWLEVAITIITNTFSSTLAAVCYALLRRGKENVDVKQLAAVFA